MKHDVDVPLARQSVDAGGGADSCSCCWMSAVVWVIFKQKKIPNHHGKEKKNVANNKELWLNFILVTSDSQIHRLIVGQTDNTWCLLFFWRYSNILTLWTLIIKHVSPILIYDLWFRIIERINETIIHVNKIKYYALINNLWILLIIIILWLWLDCNVVIWSDAWSIKGCY